MNKTTQLSAADYLESLKPSVGKKKRKKSEYPEFHKVHVPICKYIKLQYSNVFFISDTVANLFLTPQQQGRNKLIQDSDYHAPDIHIINPRGGYHGLHLEVKYETPFLKNGTLSTVKHVQDQAETIRQLCAMGFVAYFVWDVNQAKEIIDWYFKLPASPAPPVPAQRTRYPV